MKEGAYCSLLELDNTNFLFFWGLSFGLAGILFLLSYAVADQLPYSSKLSPYECGFLPIEDARNRFDVKYYLVAILFVVFDMEISFLFPWAVSLQSLGVSGFASMVVFLSILTLGFVLEWDRGILDW